MKTLSAMFILIATVVGFVGQAHADTDLAVVMQAMADSVSRISHQISDPTKNADSAQLCDTLTTSIEQAKTLMPKKVSDLPVDQQAGQTDEFVKQLGLLEAKIGELKSDLVQNDNKAAAAALADALLIRNAGHKAFR